MSKNFEITENYRGRMSKYWKNNRITDHDERISEKEGKQNLISGILRMTDNED